MAIQAIVFDLGNVLVEFSHEPIARGLAQHAGKAQYSDPVEVARYLFHGGDAAETPFDEGQISPQDFFAQISREMGLDLSYEAFVDIWNRIFHARPGADEIVRFLHGRVGLHLLSNTNALHFQYVLAQFPWVRLFDHWFLSYQVGCRKPSPQIYTCVLERVAFAPGQVLYLDDTETNLAPAREMGVQTILVPNGTPLREVLQAHLPHLPWGECGVAP